MTNSPDGRPPSEDQVSGKVWTLADDMVWMRDGNAWRVADPQPERVAQLLAESTCFSRKHHEMTYYEPRHLVCNDCGFCKYLLPQDEVPA